jgi:hypothetical protein
MAVGLGALRARLSRNSRKRKGQSLVEFTIMLPILLVMISGLVEAGIALNTYLDLIDSAREVARNLSDFDPFIDDNPLSPNVSFYEVAQDVAEYTLWKSGKIQLDPADPARDNLIVSVFRVTGSTITASERYPRNPTAFEAADDKEIGCQTAGGDELGWLLYCNLSESKIGTTECAKPGCIVMAELLGNLADIPPDTGIVAVEIYYDYHMTLGLPWITAFLPDPITLHAYSFMPNSAAEP